MLWIGEVEKNIGDIEVGMRILEALPNDSVFEVIVEDRLRFPLAIAQGRLRDLIDLMITTRETLDLGGVSIEAAPGWSGYWFLLDDDQAIMVKPKVFRGLVDDLEQESRALVRSRFRLS